MYLRNTLTGANHRAIIIPIIFMQVLQVPPILSDDCDCHEGDCGPGQYYNVKLGYCVPCPDGSFQSCFKHSCESCKPCTSPNFNFKVVSNPTSCQLFCNEGFFKAVNGPLTPISCQSCRNCLADEVELNPCTHESDRTCGKKKENPRFGSASDEDKELTRFRHGTPDSSNIFHGSDESIVTWLPDTIHNHDLKRGFEKKESTYNLDVLSMVSAIFVPISVVALAYFCRRRKFRLSAPIST